jgi:hypothetical protein
MVLTKRLLTTWDSPYVFNQDNANLWITFVNQMIAEEKTNREVVATPTTAQRDFVDQAAAEEFLAASVTWNSYRTIVSSTITDI